MSKKVIVMEFTWEYELPADKFAIYRNEKARHRNKRQCALCGQNIRARTEHLDYYIQHVDGDTVVYNTIDWIFHACLKHTEELESSMAQLQDLIKNKPAQLKEGESPGYYYWIWFAAVGIEFPDS